MGTAGKIVPLQEEHSSQGQSSMETARSHVWIGIRKGLGCKNLGTVFSLKPEELPQSPQASLLKAPTTIYLAHFLTGPGVEVSFPSLDMERGSRTALMYLFFLRQCFLWPRMALNWLCSW